MGDSAFEITITGKMFLFFLGGLPKIDHGICGKQM
jgi:hypothetical protein